MSIYDYNNDFLKENNHDQKQQEIKISEKKTQTKNLVDRHKVESYIFSHKNYFPTNKLIYLKKKLLELDDIQFGMVLCTKLKSPYLVQIVSVFAGFLGFDRFMIGDIKIGLFKLFTLGCCGLFWLYDTRKISERVKKLNFEKIALLF